MLSKQQMYYLIHDIGQKIKLCPYDIQAIIEMVLMFYVFTTYEKFKLDVWQFCMRLENS